MTDSAKRLPRALLVIIALLLCSNLATGLVAYMTIARLDKQYTKELVKTVPGLGEILLISQDATNIHRSAGNLLLARDEAEAKKTWELLQAALQHEQKRFDALFPKGPPIPGDVQEPLWLASRDYNKALQEYLALIKSGNRDAALAYRLDKLRPIFDVYQTRQREESIRLNFETMNANLEINARARSHMTMLLGLGGWPFAVMLAILTAFGAVSALIWRQLQQIEQEEKRLRAEADF